MPGYFFLIIFSTGGMGGGELKDADADDMSPRCTLVAVLEQLSRPESSEWEGSERADPTEEALDPLWPL